MPFQFLKYIQPTSYFSLSRRDGRYIYPIAARLPSNIKKQLTVRHGYSSDLAKTYDLSWQAENLGYIGTAPVYTTFEKVSIHDEYIFVATYFNKIWLLYILLLRILTLKNPIKEINGFMTARNVKRSNYLKDPIVYPKWQTFNSTLLSSQPMVTVVIPTLNRYEYLTDVLTDLEKQDYSHFEVIIVDQSDPFKREFYASYNLSIRLIHQKEKALWLARNRAIREAKGELILLFDDDSRVEPDWITNHIKCLDFFKADISSGVSISKVGDRVPAHYSFFKQSSQLDTGNVMLKKSVFRAIGLFDRQFEKQRMGDGEFGLRAYLFGFLNVSNPYAQRLHLKVGSGGLREMGSWDAFRPKKWFAPRPIPSVLYLFRNYFGRKRALLALLKTVPPSIVPYQFKRNKPLLLLGSLFSLLLLPLVLFQVIRSWNLASKKLNEGARIDEL